MTNRDVNVLLKKQQNDENNSMYPITKVGNVVIDSRTTLDKWISSQQKANLLYDTGLKKLSTIEEYAEPNQKAFGIVRVGANILQSLDERDTLTFEGNSDIIISLVDGKIKFSLGDQTIPDATESNSGLMTSTYVKKLNGIEDGANKYIHPKSNVSPGTYIRTMVDEYGHVIAANNNPLSILEGGTGANNLADIKKALQIPENITISKSIIKDDTNAVSGGAVYNALENKADKNHGNHVPDSVGDSRKYLRDGNIWDVLPSANTSDAGIIQLSLTYSRDDISKAATPKSVYDAMIEAKDYANDLITKVINGANEHFDTLKEISDWISEHTDLYNALITTIGNKVDKVSGKGLSELDFTSSINSQIDSNTTWINNHSSVSTNAEENKIDAIFVNNKEVTMSGKNAFITVPTKVSDIDNDKGYLTDHPTISVQSDTTSSATASAGDTIKIVDSLTKDSNGHILSYDTKSLTLPSSATIKNGINFGNKYEDGSSTTTNDIPGIYTGNEKLYIGMNSKNNIHINTTQVVDDSGNLKSIDFTVYDTTTTASESNEGYMSAEYVTKLNGIEKGANKYVLPVASTTLGGVINGSDVTNVAGYTPVPIVDGIPYYNNTNTTYTATSGLYADATDPTIFKHSTSKLSAGNYGDSGGNRTLTFGDSFTVEKMITDDYGHLVGHNDVVLTLPQSTYSDTNVQNVLSPDSKAYVTGTTSAVTNTGTQVFDTGVYLGNAGELVANKFTGALNGNANTATALTTSAGSTTQPIYFSNGKPVATTYSLEKSVPANALFTDTTYNNATTSTSGLMSISDKTKLDGVAAGAQVNTVTGVKGDSESSYRTGNINITKDNIGLSNVPNVTTNNQTPTYSDTSTLSTLASGEVLSTAFAKIKLAISNLITHLADTTKHITSTERTSWNTASTNSHTHSNKALLDTYTQTNTDITNAVNNRHLHENYSVINAITSAMISGYNRLVTLLSSITSVQTTVSDDDTAIPTSGAVVEGLVTKADFDASHRIVMGGDTKYIHLIRIQCINAYSDGTYSFDIAHRGASTPSTVIVNVKSNDSKMATYTISIDYKNTDLNNDLTGYVYTSGDYNFIDIYLKAGWYQEVYIYNRCIYHRYFTYTWYMVTHDALPTDATTVVNSSIIPHPYSYSAYNLYVHHDDEVTMSASTAPFIWFNYRNGANGATSGNTALTGYRFGNRNGGTAGVTLYAESFSGNSATATALTTSAGSTTQPIYFSGGKPVSCGATIQTSVSDSDSQIPTSGAVVDYAFPKSKVSTIVVDSTTAVPTSGAVVAYAIPYTKLNTSIIDSDLQVPTSGAVYSFVTSDSTAMTNKSFSNETKIYTSTYTDPDSGVARSLKVSGGAAADKLKVNDANGFNKIQHYNAQTVTFAVSAGTIIFVDYVNGTHTSIWYVRGSGGIDMISGSVNGYGVTISGLSVTVAGDSTNIHTTALIP